MGRPVERDQPVLRVIIPSLRTYGVPQELFQVLLRVNAEGEGLVGVDAK